VELKIMDDSSLGGKPKIKVYGAMEYTREDPICALWFAWELGRSGIEASYHNREEGPREVNLTVQTGEDTIAEMIKQIEAMLKKRGLRGF